MIIYASLCRRIQASDEWLIHCFFFLFFFFFFCKLGCVHFVGLDCEEIDQQRSFRRPLMSTDVHDSVRIMP